MRRYLMLIDGRRRWLPPADAGKAYADRWCDVAIGGVTLEDDGFERPITMTEREYLLDLADCWSDVETGWSEPG